MNSILFPKSKSIKELKFIEKEIPSNSHLKNDEGTLILDDVCIDKIKYLDEGKTKVKDVLIDVEMESNYQVVLIMLLELEIKMISKKLGL